MRLATEYEMLYIGTERAAMAWVMPRTRPYDRRALWDAMLPSTRANLVNIYQRRRRIVEAGGHDYSFAQYRTGGRQKG